MFSMRNLGFVRQPLAAKDARCEEGDRHGAARTVIGVECGHDDLPMRTVDLPGLVILQDFLLEQKQTEIRSEPACHSQPHLVTHDSVAATPPTPGAVASLHLLKVRKLVLSRIARELLVQDTVSRFHRAEQKRLGDGRRVDLSLERGRIEP